MTLYEQWLTFFAMGITGFLMGVYFDGLRELARVWPAFRRFQVVLDGLFWLGSLVMVAAVLWVVNQGVFRWHVLLGLLAGAGLYGWLLTRWVRRCFRRVYRFVALFLYRLGWLLHRLVIAPLVFVGQTVVRMGRFFRRGLAGIYTRITNLVKKKD